MGISTGTRLGPYEIVSPLGAGGMGEVYRARDTRLERTVAIKVLPAHLSDNVDLKQRFEREARAISALQHPNICVLYDVGHHEGIDFLVMEYLEGESLAKRLTRGPLPTSELLKYGSQIADGLEKAHRSGIIHRDLKPGNIMLTKSGAKLLDFGLAKPQAAVGIATVAAATATQANPVNGPITEHGRIVGTMQYMSPEQLQGTEVDARSDIFSLGTVLYEMATGKHAFEGKSSFSVATAILEKDPEPIGAVQPLSPPALEHVVLTCLAKEREERWQSAADVARQLQWISQAGSQTAIAAVPLKLRRRRLERMAWAAAVVTLVAVIALLAIRSRGAKSAIHAEINAPAGVTFDLSGDTSAPPVLSPDGTMLVFGGHTSDQPQALWVRSLATGEVQRLAGTDGATFPFWSPDSRWIAYFAAGKLNKVAASGGPIAAITDTPTSPRGGSWGPADDIIYTPDYVTPLWRVSAAGGTSSQMTKLAGHYTTERWPQWLPDGKHYLYFATDHDNPAGGTNGIFFASFDGKVNKLVMPSDAAGIYANGYLLYHQQNELVAQPMDASSGTLSGSPAVITDNIGYDSGTWHLLVTASANGMLAYQRGTATTGSQLTWTDIGGKTLSPVGPRAVHNGYELSPDGKRIALASLAAGSRMYDIYAMDVATGIMTRLTFDPADHSLPTWSPDGKRIVYQVNRVGAISGPAAPAIYEKAADGTGGEQLLYHSEQGGATAPAWSPDGHYLVFIYTAGPTGNQIEALPAGGNNPQLVVKPQSSQGNITEFSISRDGRWIAYTSNESGVPQIYVSAFPSGDGRWQISPNGGNNPVWSRNSDELYFSGEDYYIYGVNYSATATQFSITAMQRGLALRSTTSGRNFDISPDGKHFLLDVASEKSSAPLDLVVNWVSALKK